MEISILTLRVPHAESFSDFFYSQKMIPWLALGLLKGAYTAHFHTSTHTHNKMQHLLYILLSKAGQDLAKPAQSFRPCAAHSALSHSFLLNEGKFFLSFLPADRWSSGSDQKDVGLLSNVILMVPGVVGRERIAVTIRNLSDYSEAYIIVSFY